MNDKLITLITVLEEKKDADGFLTDEEIAETPIFASIKSVGATEYYAALRSDIQVNIIFKVDPDDFKMSEKKIAVNNKLKKVTASRIIYDDSIYEIQRTYVNKEGMLEVTCRKVE